MDTNKQETALTNDFAGKELEATDLKEISGGSGSKGGKKHGKQGSLISVGDVNGDISTGKIASNNDPDILSDNDILSFNDRNNFG